MALTKKNFYKKPEICTSWDDGYSLDLKIADYLSKYKLHGVFYVVLDWIGTAGYMTWSDIKELDSRGFEIGSHTVTHPPDLKRIHDEQLFYEIQNSKDMLEAALGHTVSKFCYPRGRYDERVKQMVIQAGYTEARTTGKPGIIEKSDMFALPGTIHIFQRTEYGELTMVQFAKHTIDTARKTGGYVNIWGHSKEVAVNNLWSDLEEVLVYATT